MKNNEILIGSHVSMNAPNFFLGSVQEAISYNSTAFMFYTGAPQNSYRVPLDRLKIEEGRKLLKEAGIDESHLVVHAPYIINPANKTREELYNQSIKTIINELQRSAAFGATILVLHPGAHVGQGTDNSVKALSEALDAILDNDGTNVRIAIETMAGKGTEIGINFEQVKTIVDGCKNKDRLGVCLDTCHVNDAGYDVKDVDGLLNEFDRIIGLDKLLVVHLNDSKNPQGAHKDRHENIGYGEIGFETLNKFVHHPLLVNIPKILETPYINEKPPYKQEIQMLKDGQFVDGWRDNF